MVRTNTKNLEKRKIKDLPTEGLLSQFLALGQIAQLDIKKIDTFIGSKIASAQEKE